MPQLLQIIVAKWNQHQLQLRSGQNKWRGIKNVDIKSITRGDLIVGDVISKYEL
jgi:hypothetical protein